MLPLIPIGSEIQIESLSRLGRPLKRFDIIVIYQNQNLICHYLHHINRSDMSEKKFVTRPLAGMIEDLPISEYEILGFVSNFKIPFVTRLKLFLS